ncbi:fibronectin type III domain-containing protein [Actinoplanes bogorensis]|uniref:Fibronectin type III domain-containing protein n=1 Tax=Paractinoplanes bogorensis TaxID=1610840 RepID=A0ABS5Z1N2_9ACTN|nr:fibronectin type III domain-containing protein [Actinoplanes bogorensis]MBU2669609.1 fibronectin type III domain-containing protein [Actinoplanes bogorensis]
MSIDPVPVVTWESARLADGDHTYVYGTERAPGRMTFAHVARVRDDEWRYWTGATWSADPAASKRLLSGVGATFAVLRLPPLYVLFTREHNLSSDSQLVAYTALSPTGPFDGPHHHGTVPDALAVHEDNGRLVITNPAHTTAGWPFWPRSTTPPAPPGLSAVTDDEYAYLDWHMVEGTGYRIYQRDVTGGQTHFARLPVAPRLPGVRVRQLIPGHRYEFRVATLAGDAEGPLSEIVAFTPHSPRRAAEVILAAGVPEAVPDSYIVSLRENVVAQEHVEPFVHALIAQHGGTVTTVLSQMPVFGVDMSEAQAIDLAAHPEVDHIEQNRLMSLD